MPAPRQGTLLNDARVARPRAAQGKHRPMSKRVGPSAEALTQVMVMAGGRATDVLASPPARELSRELTASSCRHKNPIRGCSYANRGPTCA